MFGSRTDFVNPFRNDLMYERTERCSRLAISLTRATSSSSSSKVNLVFTNRLSLYFKMPSAFVKVYYSPAKATFVRKPRICIFVTYPWYAVVNDYINKSIKMIYCLAKMTYSFSVSRLVSPDVNWFAMQFCIKPTSVYSSAFQLHTPKRNAHTGIC
jgi:hypothetical protein